MTKLLSLGVAIGISFLCVAAAQSMPLASLEQAYTNLTIPIAGGCGPGFHPIWRLPSQSLLRRRVLRRRGSARCGRGGSSSGCRPVSSSLQRLPMLGGLLTPGRITASICQVFRPRPVVCSRHHGYG